MKKVIDVIKNIILFWRYIMPLAKELYSLGIRVIDAIKKYFKKS